MQHFFASIPGWFSFKGVYDEAVKRASVEEKSTFVEIGAWKGKSTAYMAVEVINSRKPILFYTVDHWLGSDEPAHKQDPDVQAGQLYEVFKRNLKSVLKDIYPMRMSSTQAAKYFKNGSVDFLFLDGGHDYDSVKNDLKYWLPKMKLNGVIAGDDFNWTGVKKAIFEVFGENQIEVLGEGKGRHWRAKALPAALLGGSAAVAG